jgi:guanylate kinase
MTRSEHISPYNFEQEFHRIWDYIEKSGQPMSPELFAEAGMPWYRAYEATDIPHIYKHAEYTPAPARGVCEAGPSLSGKDNIMSLIQKVQPDLICPVVTATDRPRRNEEINGIDQIFYSAAEFQARKDRSEFVESSPTRKGHWFGVPHDSIKKAVECASFTWFRITDTGIKTILPLLKEQYFNVITLAILPPHKNLELYREDLYKQRKNENPTNRFHDALQEMWRYGRQDSVVFNYMVCNPWSDDGIPQNAANSIIKLLHFHQSLPQINP